MLGFWAALGAPCVHEARAQRSALTRRRHCPLHRIELLRIQSRRSMLSTPDVRERHCAIGGPKVVPTRSNRSCSSHGGYGRSS